MHGRACAAHCTHKGFRQRALVIYFSQARSEPVSIDTPSDEQLECGGSVVCVLRIQQRSNELGAAKLVRKDINDEETFKVEWSSMRNAVLDGAAPAAQEAIKQFVEAL
jgi:hypothetical protein